jgi:hypothetical protein
MRDITGSYASLSAEQRAKLANLLKLRNEYNAELFELNTRRIAVLLNYSEAGEAAVREYAALVVAPLRRKVASETSKVISEEAIDMDSLQSMLPMALMALTQSVNIPLLLTAAGLEPDMIEQFTTKVSSYFQQGMKE